MLLADGVSLITVLVVYAIPVGVAVPALISFFPAARGHWSALVLAVPSLLVGFAFTAAMLDDARIYGFGKFDVSNYIVWPLPFVVGVASVILWAMRRRAKAGKS